MQECRRLTYYLGEIGGVQVFEVSGVRDLPGLPDALPRGVGNLGRAPLALVGGVPYLVW
jgi:hypothetical protein